MKQVLIDNFTKATPGSNDPTPANKLSYRLYVSQSADMTTVTDTLTNGELVEEKIDADSFTWTTDQSGTWYFQIAVISPIGGISVYDTVQSILLDEAVTGITITPDPITGVEGITIQLSISVQATGGADGSYTVTVDDETIATIDGDDLVSLLVAGNTSVTVTSVFDSNVTETVDITVAEEPEVTGINVSPTSITDYEGTTHQLTVDVVTVGGASDSYTITTSDEEVATVDGNDVVTFEGDGSATLTIISDYDNNVTETVSVTSQALPVDTFKILVDTEETGVSNSDQFQLTGAQGTYYVAYDGKVEQKIGEQTLTFSSPGEKVIDIFGGLGRVAFDTVGDDKKLIEIQSWGDIAWQSMADAFDGCSNLNVTATDTPDLSNCSRMKSIFRNCSSLVGNATFQQWGVSNVNSFAFAFFNSSDFNIDLSDWDISSATSLFRMFGGSGLNQDMSGLSLPSSLNTMEYIFNGSAMSIPNYSKTLIGWANQVFTNGYPLNVDMNNQDGMIYNSETYDLGGEFDNAVDARSYLIDTADWAITNDVLGVEISDTSLSSEVTESTITVSFTKATGDNSSNFVYKLYSGDFALVNDIDQIESQSLEDQGTDVGELVISGLTDGQFVEFNVIATNPATGQKVIYNASSDLTLEATDPPQSSPQFIVENITEDSFGVSFDYTSVDLGPDPTGTGYRLEVILKTGTEQTDIIEGLRVDFADLAWTHTEGDEWEVRVYGYNANGDGPKSSPIGWVTNTYGTPTTTTTFTTA